MFSAQFLLHLLAIAAMTLMHAAGYNVVFGRAKILHFGPITSSLIAAYSIYLTLLKTGSWWLAGAAGLVSVLLLALLFAWLHTRLPADAFGVFSIAMHAATLTIVLNWNELTRGALGLSGIPRLPSLHTPAMFAAVTLLISAIWLSILWTIDRGAFGRKLRALAEHPWSAAALGMSPFRLHLQAFVLAGIGAFLSSLFFQQYLYLVHPSDFAFLYVPFYVMLIITGTPGSVVGVTLSTVGLILLRETIRFLPISATLVGPVRLILFGLILFLAVWWRRNSLFPVKRSI